MGIYDTVVLDSSITIDEFPFDPSFCNLSDGRRRMWQTKNLHSSMDTYAILPSRPFSFQNKSERQQDSESKDLYLYRRHPPITKWTDENLGTVEEEYPENVVDDADHWRQVRYSGTLNMTNFAVNSRIYDVNIEMKSGKLQDIYLEDERGISNLSVFPPKYMEIIDITDFNATYNGTKVSEVARRFYENEELDIPDRHIGMILSFHETRTINGEIPDFNDFFEFDENGNANYKNKSPKTWMEIIKREKDSGLTHGEEERIRLYNQIKRDRRIQESKED